MDLSRIPCIPWNISKALYVQMSKKINLNFAQNDLNNLSFGKKIKIYYVYRINFEMINA